MLYPGADCHGQTTVAELISQYQHQVTVRSDCFREAEMSKRSASRGKQVPAEEEKEKDKEKRKRTPSRAKTGAKPRQAEPAAGASGSSSRTPSVGTEKKKKRAPEMEE